MAILPSLGHLAVNKQQFGHQATETPLPLTDASGTIVYPGFPADVLFDFRLYSVGRAADAVGDDRAGLRSAGRTAAPPTP